LKAISANGDKLENKVDQRFGRCPYFLIVSIDGKEIKDFKAIKNQGSIQGHGAGIKAAEQIGELNVDAIITGELGPNATKVINELEITTYSGSGEIKEVVEDFINEKLKIIKEISEPNNNNSEIKSDEKIFFPLLNNKGLDSEISQHFGHAPFFGLYDVNKKSLTIIPNDLDHTNPNMSPIDQIEKAVNPTTIFAKGIGGRAIDIIEKKGISLKTGNYNIIKEVVNNLDGLENQTKDCGNIH